MSVVVDWNINDTIDSHQSRKNRRIKAIAEVLKSKGRVNYRQFLAQMQFNGIRKSVAKGYLDVLKELGMIKHDKENIVWNRKDKANERRPKVKSKKRRSNE